MQNHRNITFLPSVVSLLILNNAQEHISFTFLTRWLTFHLFCFLTACSKIARNVSPLCKRRDVDSFSMHWQQCR